MTDRDWPTVEPTADAFDAIQVFARPRIDRVSVPVHGRLVGLVSPGDVMTTIEVSHGRRAGRVDLLPDSGYP